MAHTSAIASPPCQQARVIALAQRAAASFQLATHPALMIAPPFVPSALPPVAAAQPALHRRSGASCRDRPQAARPIPRAFSQRSDAPAPAPPPPAAPVASSGTPLLAASASSTLSSA